jgi:four helix bundle protein
MESSFKTFEDLACWKSARELKIYAKEITKKFPKEEKYRLTDQIIRASRSVGANIAEGYGRFSFQENAKFCRDARGSLTETLNHMIDALDENYINKEELNEFRKLYDKCLLILNGYIAYLLKAKNENATKAK